MIVKFDWKWFLQGMINLLCKYLLRKGHDSFEDLCNSADEELFSKIKTSPDDILHALLPPPSIVSQNYGLRQRVHSFQLPERSTHLSDCNFLMRMLYKNSY